MQALWDDKGRLSPTDANGKPSSSDKSRSISCAVDVCTMNAESEFDLCLVPIDCGKLEYYEPLPGCASIGGNNTTANRPQNDANATVAPYISGEWRCAGESTAGDMQAAAAAFLARVRSPPYQPPAVSCSIHTGCGFEQGLTPVWVDSSDPKQSGLQLLDGTDPRGGLWTCCDNVSYLPRLARRPGSPTLTSYPRSRSAPTGCNTDLTEILRTAR